MYVPCLFGLYLPNNMLFDDLDILVILIFLDPVHSFLVLAEIAESRLY